MSWFERTDESPTRRSRRDWQFWAALATAILVLVVVAIPLGQSLVLMYRYHGFMQDLSASATYGRHHGTTRLTIDGEESGAGPDQVSSLIEVLSDYGMGHPNDLVPDEPGVVVDFGDGSSLRLWPVEITEASRERDEGLLIRYTRADGEVFAFDTDRLSYKDALAIIGA